MELYSKGKRGLVYLSIADGKRVIVKTVNPKSKAFGRIESEAKFLQILNKHGIGPKFLFLENEKLGMEFIDGVLIEEYLRSNNKKKILKLIENIFAQLFLLDKLGINKEEMHHPVKHIIITGDKPVMIDFERCHYTEKPKNVSQFVQFLRFSVRDILTERSIMVDDAILSAIKEYKKNICDKTFKKILGCIR